MDDVLPTIAIVSVIAWALLYPLCRALFVTPYERHDD